MTHYLIQSILLHVVFIFLLVTNIFFLGHHSVDYIPAIKVDIVALPDKQIPKKITPLPPAKTTVQKASEVKKSTPPLKPPNIQALKKKQQPKANKVQAKKPPKPQENYEQLYQVGQNAIERLKHLKKIEAKQNIIKGNRLAPGTALQGIDQLDYNNYIGRLHLHIQSHWKLPQWLAISEQLATVVKVYLDADGYVIERQLIESSGDPRFDQIVLSAIDTASPFPPPEDKFINIVRFGITLTAKP